MGSTMKLSKAIEGFVIAKTAEGLATSTIETYERRLEMFSEHVEDPELSSLRVEHIKQFMAWLRTDHVGPRGPISEKTRYNYWTALKSFTAWASAEHLLDLDLTAQVRAPDYNSPPPDPFTKDEVAALLRAINAPGTDQSLRARNRAIVFLLLDTGIRAAELLALTTIDVDLKRRRVYVRKGKGNKGRFVYLGTRAQQALWEYQTTIEPGPLFKANHGGGLKYNAFRQQLRRLGDVAGVHDCHAHRFRHTFAINYLRNGGDIFTLQQLLGHTSLDMVYRYLHITQHDTEQAHKRASPADNWQL